MPTSGALDSLAFQIGNILLGNPYESPGIETTMIGPTIKFKSNMWICITGAQSSPMLNGNEIQMWKPIYVKENSILSWGPLNWGIRSYILFNMNMEIEKTMNSYSTNTSLGIGGYNDGSPLQKGDKINLINSLHSIPSLNNNFDYLDLSIVGVGEEMIATYFQQSLNMSGDIYAVRIDADGNPTWTGEEVEVTNSGNSKSDMMVGEGQGCLFIAWTENGNVYAHSLREDGILGSPDSFVLGDVNGDGTINVLDIIEIIGFIMDNQYVQEGDYNGDGE